jgi:hypothetical protein
MINECVLDTEKSVEINQTSLTNLTNQNYQKDECVELKNIKYKTMLLCSGNPKIETKSSNDLSNLEKFLENEKNNNKIEPWSKLDKTMKTKKLIQYVNKYKSENELSDDEEKLLVIFLKDCVDKKKLIRVKDVIYDKETGSIKNIPALIYNKQKKHFTLKNIDKRLSTLKNLPNHKKTTSVNPTISIDVNSDSL